MQGNKIALLYAKAGWCPSCEKIKEWLPEFCENAGVDLEFIDVESVKGAELGWDLVVDKIPTILAYKEISELYSVLHIGTPAPELLEKLMKEANVWKNK